MARRKSKRSTKRKSGAATKGPAASAGPKRGRGRRYTEPERQRILETARREGLSGPKAAKRFGISTLTFYNWRKKRGGSKARAASVSSHMNDEVLATQVRKSIRAAIERLLPDIIRSEVDGLLGSVSRRK